MSVGSLLSLPLKEGEEEEEEEDGVVQEHDCRFLRVTSCGFVSVQVLLQDKTFFLKSSRLLGSVGMLIEC